MTLPISCPLCCHIGFASADALCLALLSTATRQLTCPVCHDAVLGLDKLTIHLVSHSILDLHPPVGRTWSIITDTTVTDNCASVICLEKNWSKEQKNLDSFVKPSSPLKNLPTIDELIDLHSISKELESLDSALSDADITQHKTSDSREIAAKPDTSMAFEEKGSELSCDRNDEQNDRRSSSWNHERTTSEYRRMDTDEVTFSCNTCDFSFPDAMILATHRQLVHEGITSEVSKKSFSCQLCAKMFKMRGSLMIHRRVAHSLLPGESKSGDVASETTVSVDSAQFACSYCGKTFRKEQHLSQHAKMHDAKQWTCDTCGKHFTTRCFLKKHARLHTGEQPYACVVCNKAFTFQQSYRKHLLYHSAEKPYECADCGRSFKELSTLHNHERIHSGEKPFACQTCGKCFRQRVSYLVHCRIHTGVKPYKCASCGKSFRYKVSERSHKCSPTPVATITTSCSGTLHSSTGTSKDAQHVILPAAQQVMTSSAISYCDLSTASNGLDCCPANLLSSRQLRSDTEQDAPMRPHGDNSFCQALDLYADTADFLPLTDCQTPSQQLSQLPQSSSPPPPWGCFPSVGFPALVTTTQGGTATEQGSSSVFEAICEDSFGQLFFDSASPLTELS